VKDRIPAAIKEIIRAQERANLARTGELEPPFGVLQLSCLLWKSTIDLIVGWQLCSARRRGATSAALRTFTISAIGRPPDRLISLISACAAAASPRWSSSRESAPARPLSDHLQFFPGCLPATLAASQNHLRHQLLTTLNVFSDGAGRRWRYACAYAAGSTPGLRGIVGGSSITSDLATMLRPGSCPC
jgi:hypothetical protein